MSWNGRQPGDRPDIPSVDIPGGYPHMEDNTRPHVHGTPSDDVQSIGFASAVERVPPESAAGTDAFFVRARFGGGMPVTIRDTTGLPSPDGSAYPPSVAVAIGEGRHLLAAKDMPAGYVRRLETDRAFGYCAHRLENSREYIAPTEQALAQNIPVSGGGLQTGMLTIDSGGAGYSNSGFDRPIAVIMGDGTGGGVSSISIDSSGVIQSVNISPAGTGYTWAYVRLYLPARPPTGWAWGHPVGDEWSTYGWEPRYRLPSGGGYLNHPMPTPGSVWAPLNPGLEMGQWDVDGPPSGGATRFVNFRHEQVSPGSVERVGYCGDSWGVNRYFASFDQPFGSVIGDWGMNADVSYRRTPGVPTQRWRWVGVVVPADATVGIAVATAWRYIDSMRLGADMGIRARWVPIVDGGQVVGFDSAQTLMGVGYAGSEGWSVEVNPGATPPVFSLQFATDEQGFGRVANVLVLDPGSEITTIDLVIADPTQVVADSVFVRAHPLDITVVSGSTWGIQPSVDWLFDSVSQDGGPDFIEDTGTDTLSTSQPIGDYIISREFFTAHPFTTDVAELAEWEDDSAERPGGWTAWEWNSTGVAFNDGGVDDGSRELLTFEGDFGELAWAATPWRSVPQLDTSWHLAAVEVGVKSSPKVDPNGAGESIMRWYGQQWLELYEAPLPLPFSVGGPAGAVVGQVPS